MLTQKELKQNLYTALKELGLNEHEINLYTISLAIGPANISKLAEHLGIPRPNVYKLIAGLEEHGLAKFSHRKKYARTFSVEQPSLLLQKLREKREDISQITHNVTGLMPDLYSLYHQGETPTNVKILKTEQEYVEAVESMLHEVEDEIRFFGSFDHWVNTVTPEKFRRFTDLRIKRNIISRTLILPTAHAADLKKTEQEDKRVLKILKNSPEFNTSYQITQHKVLIWQPMGPLALLIEDEYIVKMLNATFELLWQNCAD